MFLTNSAKKTNLDQIKTIEKAKLGPDNNSTTYMCVYIYTLWCYYLGQVWLFEVLLSGPSFLFTKHCLSKTPSNRGFSIFFWTNCARSLFNGCQCFQRNMSGASVSHRRGHSRLHGMLQVSQSVRQSTDGAVNHSAQPLTDHFPWVTTGSFQQSRFSFKRRESIFDLTDRAHG